MESDKKRNALHSSIQLTFAHKRSHLLHMNKRNVLHGGAMHLDDVTIARVSRSESRRLLQHTDICQILSANHELSNTDQQKMSCEKQSYRLINSSHLIVKHIKR